MLRIEFSNRFEHLLSALLDRMGSNRESPFTPDEIIIPSAAVRRRIELSAADRFGVCANVEFSYLAEWLWRQIGRFVDVAAVSPFKTPVLTWRVFHHLADDALVKKHPRLASYLKTADPTMRYELASRVAALFDQYLTYRPDWLAAWQDRRHVSPADATDAQQQDERWQAALWQRIAEEIGTARQHPSVAFFEAIKADVSSSKAELPKTAHVFCLPATPPLYLDILRGLGRWIDVHLYVMNPCREYWFEIVDPKRLSYLKATAGADATHHEVGNKLLASWGKQTRAHIDLLIGRHDDVEIDEEFSASDQPTLLARVQDAILDMVDPAPGSFPLDASDRSIEIHVCHSLTRQLEVLHDQLLGLFASTTATATALKPSDVVVLTPNLQDAAPLIDAVFGTVPLARRIPYAITGRPPSAQNSAARSLLSILSVATSRFQASVVFDLLQQPIVARRFDIDTDDRETIHRWIRQSGIRWGIDATHRVSLQLPESAHYTFDDGLDRLFMGYALPSKIVEPLDGRLPAGNAEGSGALALGSFNSFVMQLESLRNQLARDRAPLEWRGILHNVLTTFLQPIDDEVEDVRETQATIRDLCQNMSQGGAENHVSFDVLIAALRQSLDDATRGGVPTGAVTFSSLTSLRSLPYRHVCVIGLDDGAFPSASRPDEFDLMALTPRRGDRQRRLDDRNLFLDVLLSARERLYLSYTGRSVRDNAVLPPSVVVAEFVDYVTSAAAASPVTKDSLADVRKRLTVEHPLQPFSSSYFDASKDARERSFNDEYRAALSARLDATRGADLREKISIPGSSEAAAKHNFAPSPEDEEIAIEAQRAFFAAPLADADHEFRVVTVRQIDRFLFNPSQYLLKERLKVDLARAEEVLGDDEPFVPEWADRRDLANRVLPRLLDADHAEGAINLSAIARAGIEYPPGKLGEIELQRELERINLFAARVREDTVDACLPPSTHTLEFDLDGETWTLTGAFSDLRPSGLVRYLYDDVRSSEYLTGWTAHLFLNAVAPAGVARVTRWHSRDGDYTFKPCDEARERLKELMLLYRTGLHRPLHFYPRSAWKYATTGKFSDAYVSWRTTPWKFYPGEDQKPGYSIALRGVPDPLDEEFTDAATIVYGPLLNHIEDARL